ncbi:MAG: hypothetical protein U9N62_01615 [Thermotogota bacterium]|nr:hypothetical protein [Thermotogota bacterium]
MRENVKKESDYMIKRIGMFLLLSLIALTLFSEKVVMVFPNDDNVIVLFDDNSWFYHSQISWYDMVDFTHFDEESGFAVLEENSYRVGENQIMIQGIAMNTSNVEKGCLISYTLFGENQEYLTNEKLLSQNVVKPGRLFQYEIIFNDFQGIPKYVKFDYIRNLSE